MKKHSTVAQSSEQGRRHRKTCKRWLTIGLDLGDKSSRCCALDEGAEVVFEYSLATTKKAIAELFAGLEPCLIAMEVGTHSPWVSRLLTRLGHQVIVANAREVKLITESSRKKRSARCADAGAFGASR